MKKELLMASALVSTMGVASVAQAVTATMSGHHDAGLQGTNLDAGSSDTLAVKNTSSFSVSLSETTDGGVGVATSFMLANEGDAGLHTAGLTLTFTDGSKLDLLNAGNAAKSHDISVPGGAGKPEGISITTTNMTQDGLDFFGEDTGLSFEWHSASDFIADGLKLGASYSVDNGAAAGASTKLDSSWGLGATYVTTAGDTTLTVGAGIADSTFKDSGTDPSNNSNGYHVGFSAVTGDLTVAVGYADGDKTTGVGANTNKQVDADVLKAGIKYVTGDITMNVGVVSGTATDNIFAGTDTATDAHDEVNASLTYAVASGVSAILGYTTVDQNDEGGSATTGGSSWYIGATMSF
jgi:hypothetical protein